MSIKELWLKLSERNRKRIVSFLNSFVVSFLLFFALSLKDGGFPADIAAFLSLCFAAGRSATKELLDVIIFDLKKDDVDNSVDKK
jgi:hypothetical protein